MNIKLKRLTTASRASLRRRVIATIFLPIVVIYVATITYQTLDSYSDSLERAHKAADYKAQSLAGEVEKQMLNDMTNCQTLARIMEKYDHMPRKERVEVCDGIVWSLLEANPHYMAVWHNWQLFTLDPNRSVEYGRIRSSLARINNVATMSHDTLDFEGENEASIYHLIHQSGLATVTDPYYEDYQGQVETQILEASICCPMFNTNGIFTGLFGVDVSLDSFQDMFNNLDIDEDTHAVLFSGDGHIVASTVSSEKGMAIADIDTTSSSSIYTEVVPVRTSNEGNDTWHLALMFDNKLVVSDARWKFIKYMGIGVIGLLLIWLLFVHYVSIIVKPIIKITEYANNLSQGRLNVNLDVDKNRRDEFGQVSRALVQMGKNMSSTINELSQCATLLNSTARSIKKDAGSLAELSMHQASSMQQINTSMQEINNASTANHHNAEKALSKSDVANVKMKEGSSIVDEASNAMKDIRHHLSTIRDIAKQTTILSLNANVEAARAGSMGKGFTVVAISIRDLAEKCTQVAGTIEDLVKVGDERANAAVDSINGVVPEIKETASLVKDITNNSYAQSTAVTQITSAINSLNDNSQKAAERAEMMTDYANELAVQSDRLQLIVEKFDLSEDED